MNIRTDLAGRLKEGRQLARRSHREQDLLKLGNLRAGNSGVMTEGGDIAGSCHRLAHLRSLGIDIDEPDDSKLIMFQVGTANEDIVYADLLHTKGPDEVILRETEIPTSWLTENGVKVTGRPDMVVCRNLVPSSPLSPVGDVVVLNSIEVPPEPQDRIVPLFGIEIKSIASVWTSRDILKEGVKLEHLIQAAHYSWQLGVPFRLLYKQYSIQEIPSWRGKGDEPGWGQKLFPRDCPHIDYEKGRIQPFEITYEIDTTKDFIEYRREGTGEWIRSLVAVADIKRFYEFVSRMALDQELGPRPINVDPQGNEKSWKKCDKKYCSLSDVCKKNEKLGYDVWLAAVKRFSKK